MSDEKDFETSFWEGTDPKIPFAPKYPGYKPHTKVDKEMGIICEYDVKVSMRDKTKIYVDVFRPLKNGEHPSLIAWSPYGKHHPFTEANSSRSGVGLGELSEYCAFEAPDPAYWCAHGFVVINADPRGAWGSEGELTFFSDQEAYDCYDLIEWTAMQPWSNGRVGMLGVSYLAWIQWKVASLNPPHLTAICPWEGASDFYREVAFHGGIPNNVFWRLSARCSWCYSSMRRVEDLVRMADQHPLFDEYWSSKNPDLSKIRVPAFVVANWGDHGLHTRGSLEAFKRISSKEKYLLIHGRKKWEFFRQMVDLQRLFFDRYLKGIDNEVKNWPRVRLEVRERYFLGNFRNEDNWPLTQTRYAKLFLHEDGTLKCQQNEKETSILYDSKTGEAKFDYEFDKETELTGYMKLKLWVQAQDSDDMDLFVGIEKYDCSGDFVRFPHNILPYDYGPVALGWLRVSHRELDEEKSTVYQPVHRHRKLLKLKQGEIVPVEIEIWPSSTLFRQREKLRLVIRGRDILTYPNFAHTETVNKGTHIIYTGGKYDSHLLIPLIP